MRLDNGDKNHSLAITAERWAQIKAIVAGRSAPGSVLTDRSGKPQRIENDFPGKPFVGRIEPDAPRGPRP